MMSASFGDSHDLESSGKVALRQVNVQYPNFEKTKSLLNSSVNFKKLCQISLSVKDVKVVAEKLWSRVIKYPQV